MQLVVSRACCVSGVAETRAGVLAKGDALDGMQLICGLAAQHQPPPILLHLQCTSKWVSRGWNIALMPGSPLQQRSAPCSDPMTFYPSTRKPPPP